jgi:peroxiredoxin
MRKTHNRGQQVGSPSPPVSRRPLDWKLIVIPILVVAALLGIGLIIRHSLASSAPTVATNSKNAAAAPDFTVTIVNGPQFSLAAQRGHPVILFFSAASCTSCLAESNALGQIQRKYGAKLRIVLIDIGPGDTPGSVRDFVQRSQGPSQYWVLDTTGKLATLYGARSLDTTIVIDKQGRIAYRDDTPLDYSTADQVVKKVV